MRIYKEVETIRDFKFDRYAAHTMENIVKAGKVEELDNLLGEIFPDGCTEDELNNFMWSDEGNIYIWLGMDGQLDKTA